MADRGLPGLVNITVHPPNTMSRAPRSHGGHNGCLQCPTLVRHRV